MPQQQSHEHYMQLALEQAQMAYDAEEVPVGAVLVCQDKVIATGYNAPIEQHDPTAHAEISVIRQAGRVLKNYRMPDTTLYVTVEPCPMCLGAIMHARIGTLVYGAPEPKFGSIEGEKGLIQPGRFNHELTIISGILASECRNLMSGFFQMRRQQKKQK